MNWTDEIFLNFCRGKIDDFYSYLYPYLLIYASSRLSGNDVTTAEDLVQDAVEKAYLNAESFSSAAQWKAFIITCIRNRAISLIRKENAKGNYLNETFNSSMLTRDVMTDYIEVETRTRLFNAIATLPPELRQIFNLSFEEGLRNPEIAARLGVAEITIKKRKARLITRLRDIFGISPDLLLAIDIIYYSNLFKPT